MAAILRTGPPQLPLWAAAIGRVRASSCRAQLHIPCTWEHTAAGAASMIQNGLSSRLSSAAPGLRTGGHARAHRRVCVSRGLPADPHGVGFGPCGTILAGKGGRGCGSAMRRAGSACCRDTGGKGCMLHVPWMVQRDALVAGTPVIHVDVMACIAVLIPQVWAAEVSWSELRAPLSTGLPALMSTDR